YLKTKTNNSEESLHNLFKENQLSVSDFENPRKIIDAFDKIKILDPACGSGAFPMGALHKINMALQKLDPDAEIWKNKQLDAIEDDLLKEDLKKKLNKSNAEYIRKLGIVKKSIYGIDIQPIATEISKLRCFLSLVVDETIIDTEDNRNIYTLPNLEFKFVTANTLIDLENTETQGTLDFGQTNDDLENLQKIRDKYLNESNNQKKSHLKEKFIELQKQIAYKEFKSIGAGENRKAQQIIGWNPFSHEKSEWFNPKWMFGVEKFDVVIGNPPYIQLQKAINSEIKLADLYKNQNYKTFERTGDIYSLFYEKAAEILAQNGLLCFITSNKWMRANYGKSLRKYFAIKNPVKLIDMGPGVFNSATVDTNILLLQNTTNKNQLQALTFTKQHNIEKLQNNDFITLKNLSEESWIVLSDAEFSIKQKIEKIGTPLKDWDINIYRGILTGYNEAFIIDGKTKDELIAADAKNAEIIKPILRGRDIKRYKAEFADLWLIATHNGYKNEKGIKIPPIDIENYPTIKEYLNQFYPQLDKRQDKGKTPYNLRNCAYHQEFEKEKIVYMEIQTDNKEDGYEFPSFAYGEKDTIVLNTAYIITGSAYKYILTVLNSKLVKKLVKHYVTQLQKRQFRMLSMYVEKFPIRAISESEQKPFEDKVEEIIRLKELGEDTSQLEAEIDKMVYQLYGLTEEEIKIIEGKNV
ncbi:MAG: Eco57I restriction-modification methylase domain-containing protein, partial [Bacteroidales bacterium]|nr:Eco57I restriction-modification methylase domain-containing protein [Bacteroidales bacterium]